MFSISNTPPFPIVTWDAKISWNYDGKYFTNTAVYEVFCFEWKYFSLLVQKICQQIKEQEYNIQKEEAGDRWDQGWAGSSVSHRADS